MYNDYEIVMYLKEKEKIAMHQAARKRLYRQAKAGKSGRMAGMAQGFAIRIAALALKASERLQAAAEAGRENKITPQAA